jgi:hypothetical protein
MGHGPRLGRVLGVAKGIVRPLFKRAIGAGLKIPRVPFRTNRHGRACPGHPDHMARPCPDYRGRLDKPGDDGPTEFYFFDCWTSK